MPNALDINLRRTEVVAVAAVDLQVEQRGATQPARISTSFEVGEVTETIGRLDRRFPAERPWRSVAPEGSPRWSQAFLAAQTGGRLKTAWRNCVAHPARRGLFGRAHRISFERVLGFLFSSITDIAWNEKSNPRFRMPLSSRSGHQHPAVDFDDLPGQMPPSREASSNTAPTTSSGLPSRFRGIRWIKSR